MKNELAKLWPFEIHIVHVGREYRCIDPIHIASVKSVLMLGKNYTFISLIFLNVQYFKIFYLLR